MRNKILIVDDEADIVSMLKDYFELNGYDTITATSGIEAIKQAEKQPDIIELLSQHIGQVFSKERIYELVWSYDSEGDSSVVAEHIRRIRTKFGSAGMKLYIETVWGVGYKWTK